MRKPIRKKPLHYKPVLLISKRLELSNYFIQLITLKHILFTLYTFKSLQFTMQGAVRLRMYVKSLKN